MTREAVRTHKDLKVWSCALDLAEAVYRLTETFPLAERFGLAGQMRRAAISISSNIAEGAGRGSTREFLKFLRIAMGSLAELESQLVLARRLGFRGRFNEVEGRLAITGRLLGGLSSALRKRLRG